MCFNSPDEMSPFDRGGINSYAYCLNDPINRNDPSGYFSATSLIKPFKNLKNQIVRPYYKVASKIRSATSKPLINQYDQARINPIEDASAAAHIIKKQASITLITNKESLNIIKSTNLQHKFILTRDNQLIVGSGPFRATNAAFELKHSAIARIAASDLQVDNRIVSAGIITETPNGYQITNDSGHYKPAPEVNTLAKFKLRSLGVNATSKTHQIRATN